MRAGIIFILASFILGGCAIVQKDLPYMMSTSALPSKGAPLGCDEETDAAGQHPQSVLSLCKAVLEAAPPPNEKNYSEECEKSSDPCERWSVLSIQEKFEAVLLNQETLLMASDSKSISKSMLSTVASKGLMRYAFEPANPDQSLDRFDEFLRSTLWVVKLPPVKADRNEKETMLGEPTADAGSQWCGAPSALSCPIEDQILYRIDAIPDNLHEKLQQLSNSIRNGQKRDINILVLGYEIPWDKKRTLIRYGVTFYFEENLSTKKLTFLGTDFIYANEATPAPYLPQSQPMESALPSRKERSKITIRDFISYPVAIVIGGKNAVFEIAKAPFSFIGGIIAGRDALWKYPLENVHNAYQSFRLEVATGTGEGDHLWDNATDIWRPIHRLLTEIPIVGPIFLYSPNYADDPQDAPKSKLFISRGIYGGSKWGQDTGLWAAFAKEAYPDYEIYAPPYRHGTAIDVLWSLLNFSNGPAYDEAAYIMKHAGRNDTIFLAGHSGGVQRSVAATRILWYHGYPVTKVMGIAGPSIGQAFVDRRYPDSFRIYLNKESGANEDIVSRSGWAVGQFATVIDFGLRAVPKYAVGGLCFSNEKCRMSVHGFFDRLGVSNAKISSVESKPSTQHQTPLRLFLTDRLIFDGYVRTEFSAIFRNDLQQLGTIPWRKTE